MGKLSRNKGNEAERQVIKLLQPLVDDAYRVMRESGYKVGTVPQLQRNTLQSDKGGFDIAGLPWTAIEVKDHKVLAVPEWWRQCTAQAEKAQAEPILIYRRTGGAWHFRVNCKLNISDEHSFACYADIGWVEFAHWFGRRCAYEAHLDIQRRAIR